MHHDWRVDSEHVFMALGKDVLVFLQKRSERLTDWWTSESANSSRSLRPWVIEEYLFQPLDKLYNRLLFFYAHGL